jgi:hypothetical protein
MQRRNFALRGGRSALTDCWSRSMSDMAISQQLRSPRRFFSSAAKIRPTA